MPDYFSEDVVAVKPLQRPTTVEGTDQPLRDHETDEHRREREQYLRRWVAELGEG